MRDVQQRAAELLSAANAQVEAPLRLHAQVRALRAEAAARRRRRFRLAGFATAGAVSAAAAVAALAVGLSSSPEPPTVAQVAALRTLDAERPAPARTEAQLAVSAEGLAFPNWGPELGWRATGVRRDVVAGRRVTTVLYEKAGRTVAYAIVAGEPLDAAGAEVVRNGVRLHVGDGVVTWWRNGRLCILSGDAVPPATLEKLAAWGGVEAVRS